MSGISSLARPEILALRAYESARSLVEAQSSVVFLDANESPFPHSPHADEAPLNRYPEPQPKALVRRFSELYRVPERSLAIGRGSDEAIDLMVRTFCRAGQDSILICPPTYGVYEISAQIQGASVVRVPLRLAKTGPELNEPAIREAVLAPEPRIKVVFLCSPNNPTGTAFDPDQLSRICEAATGRSLVVVDEAYAEFSGANSMTEKLDRYANLVVLRTLSKAWAMAGARCGAAIASPETILLLQKVRAPYPLSAPSIQAVLSGTAPDAQAALSIRLRALREARDRLVMNLRELSGITEIFESKANFILARFKNPSAVMQATRSAGIILRDRGGEPGLQGCIRITVGNASENEALVSTLRKAAV